jgi:type II secretory pathway pseudopilin PulG
MKTVRINGWATVNKKIIIPLAIFGSALAVAAIPTVRGVRFASVAQAQEANPQAAQLLSQFLQALQNGDDAARERAVLPFLHRSLLSDNGQALDSSVRIQFKKASQNAKLYATPADVTRVRSKGTITIGEGGNPEKGRVEDYFLAKKNGAPAPITIFFPENGAPKVYYMGSL